MQRMIATLLLVFPLSIAMAQKTTGDSAIVGLENAWNQAELHRQQFRSGSEQQDDITLVIARSLA